MLSSLRIKKLILVNLIFFNLLIINAQLLPKGTYIGYEQNYDPTRPIVHKKNEKLSKWKLYYEVTLNVLDSSVIITKLPILYTDKRLTNALIDSACGGYYYYKAKINSENDQIYISGSLCKCKYCSNSGSAVPMYVYISYKVNTKRNKLFLSNEYEINMVFRKKISKRHQHILVMDGGTWKKME